MSVLLDGVADYAAYLRLLAHLGHHWHILQSFQSTLLPLKLLVSYQLEALPCHLFEWLMLDDSLLYLSGKTELLYLVIVLWLFCIDLNGVKEFILFIEILFLDVLLILKVINGRFGINLVINWLKWLPFRVINLLLMLMLLFVELGEVLVLKVLLLMNWLLNIFLNGLSHYFLDSEHLRSLGLIFFSYMSIYLLIILAIFFLFTLSLTLLQRISINFASLLYILHKGFSFSSRCMFRLLLLIVAGGEDKL